MADEINHNIIDLYEEHVMHLKGEPNCSTCFGEMAIIEAELEARGEMANLINDNLRDR